MKFSDTFTPGDKRIDEGQVITGSARDDISPSKTRGFGQKGDLFKEDFGIDSRSNAHFSQVAQQSKTADIGTGVNAKREHHFGGVFVEGQHMFYGDLKVFIFSESTFHGGGEDTITHRFGENESIAW